MAGKQFSRTLGLRGRLVALVVLSTLPLLVFAGAVLYSFSEAQREATQSRVGQQADLLASVLDREIGNAQALAAGLASSPSLDRGDLQSFYQQVRRALPGSERWIVVFNRDRDQLLNTARPFGAVLPKGVRAPAVEETLTTGRPAVMDLMVGSVVGEPVVGTSVPVLRNGNLIYVLALTLTTDRLSRLLMAQDNPEGWTVAILDRSGRIIARNRDPELFVGEYAVKPLRESVVSAHSGRLRVPTLEGDDAYAEFRRSTVSGWSVVVGAPVAVLEARMWRSLMLLSGGGAALLLIGSGFALWSARSIAGPVRSLSAVAAAIGHSDFVPPPKTGIPEVNEVAKALINSAILLRSRERERDRAEAALRDNEARLRRAHEAGGICEWEWSPEAGVIHWSDSMYRLVGRSPETFNPHGNAFIDLIHPRDRERVLCEARKTVSGENGRLDTEFRIIRPDGSVQWLAARGERESDGRDGFVRLVGINFDITPRKESEERQRLLIGELNHRVKNNLASVLAIAMHTRRSAPSPETFYDAFEKRLLALSRTHDLLTNAEWGTVELEHIAATVLEPFGTKENGRISLKGRPARIEPNVSVVLGMAIHELATNAAKHGALSVTEGSVALHWEINEEGGVRIVWTEHGGPRVEAPSRRGFGLRLIESGLSRQIGGLVNLNFKSSGLECVIYVPPHQNRTG